MMHLLRLLPPETAHALSLFALRLGLGPALKTNPGKPRQLFGKPLRMPVGLSGGADKEAAALPAWAKMGFGLVEAGTVTLKPRAGNPAPRIWRLPGHALINWLGLPGSGVLPFIKNLKAFQHHPARKTLIVGASIASPGHVLAEFTTLAAAVAPLVDYITLNASCPNVAHGGKEDAQLAGIAAEIRAAKAGAGKVPVLVKLGPTDDAGALAQVVDTALAAGADGFVATNTVPFASRALLKKEVRWAMHDGKEVGGYSGPELLAIACWMVAEIRKKVGRAMPVIGVGGVQDGDGAARLLAAGADAVQLYTGLVYRGQDVLEEIAAQCGARE